MDKLIGWLLEGPPWVQYRTRLELLGQPEDNYEVSTARQAVLKYPQIKALLTELSGWPFYSMLVLILGIVYKCVL